MLNQWNNEVEIELKFDEAYSSKLDSHGEKTSEVSFGLTSGLSKIKMHDSVLYLSCPLLIYAKFELLSVS